MKPPTILQLGSPSGYPPLRRYLLDAARAEGVARDSDDILITSGCQQAIDLLQSALIRRRRDGAARRAGLSRGPKNVFERAGRATGRRSRWAARASISKALERILIERERPRLLCVTPNFQNPTGATHAAGRASGAACESRKRPASILIENDIYGALATKATPLPSIKQLDETRRYDPAAQFFENRVSGTARGLGHRAPRR